MAHTQKSARVPITVLTGFVSALPSQGGIVLAWTCSSCASVVGITQMHANATARPYR